MIKINSKLVFDFDHALDKLSAAVGENALRSAGFAGAAVFRDEVIQQAPKATGFMSQQVGVIRATEKSDGNAVQTYLVKVRTNAHKYTNNKHNVRKRRVLNGESLKTYNTSPAFYWRFFEYGTSKMPARPFIRPAYESKKSEALQAMKTKLAEKISEALRSGA